MSKSHESADDTDNVVKDKLTMLNSSKSDDYIKIVIKDRDDKEMYFTVRKDFPLRKVMNEFCEKKEVTMRSREFLFDGLRVRPEQTPQELKLEDEDEIEIQVVVHQTGGGGAF